MTNLVLYPHFEEVRGAVEPWLMARWKARVEFLLRFYAAPNFIKIGIKMPRFVDPKQRTSTV